MSWCCGKSVFCQIEVQILKFSCRLIEEFASFRWRKSHSQHRRRIVRYCFSEKAIFEKIRLVESEKLKKQPSNCGELEGYCLFLLFCTKRRIAI